MQKLATKMNETIDFDESKIEGRLIPKNSIDQTLDEYRETYAHLGEFLVSLFSFLLLLLLLSLF